MIIGTDTWYCADGSISYFNPWSACNTFKTCPDPTWTLSTDQNTCTRPDFSCVGLPANANEEKLLAAMIYAEASTSGNAAEMFGIGSAIVRMRDAYNLPSVNALVVKLRGYSSSIQWQCAI